MGIVLRCLSVIILVSTLLPNSYASTNTPDQWHVKAEEILKHAVSIPTTASQSQNQMPRLANYLADQFRAAGIPEDDIHVLPYNHTVALIVRLKAAQPSGKKPIMVMSHMDVVEAKRDDWSMDPFTLIKKDGYYYGRGTLDIKNGLVATTVAVLELKSENFQTNRDIILFFTGDEESGGTGAKIGATKWKHLLNAEYGLNSDMGDGGFTADGRTLGFIIQTAEKTYADFMFTVRNKGGHSSQPRSDNAIYTLADALKRLEAYRFNPVLTKTTRAYFSVRQKSEHNALGNAMRSWLKNPADDKAADIIESTPGEIGLTRTRCVATRLFAGHANNALPQLATATINCRIMPGETPDAVKAELERIVADPKVVVTRLDHNESSPESPLREDIFNAYQRSIHVPFPSAPVMPAMSTGATDARPFRSIGIPVYGVNGAWVIVPEDMRAHGRDERLPVKALTDNVDHWVRMLKELAG